jgi:hypothetical protein
MIDVERLGNFEKDELLRWFMHWLPQEKRRELMQRYPQHYNKLVGRDLLVVNKQLEDEHEPNAE